MGGHDPLFFICYHKLSILNLFPMRKIIVISMVSMDGVMQAPGGPKEDTSGGFKFGGWTASYSDETGDKVVQKELGQKTDYLLGRKTFDIWEKYWPLHGDFWPQINIGTKYVLSSSKTESEWKNSVFLKNVEDIKKLKETDGPDIQVWGSSQLIQLLLKNDLVDELRLKTYPLTLGSGKKIFSSNIPAAAFKLTESIVTETGVIIASYKRDGKVKTGTIKV
jgi:dihydrofolate reductase